MHQDPVDRTTMTGDDGRPPDASESGRQMVQKGRTAMTGDDARLPDASGSGRQMVQKCRTAMTGDDARLPAPETETEGAAPGKTLTPEARRALAEAAERRAAIDARAAELAKTKEHQGRGGLEPVRYEDWEVKGLATDF
jgi:hypothetical protein